MNRPLILLLVYVGVAAGFSASPIELRRGRPVIATTTATPRTCTRLFPAQQSTSSDDDGSIDNVCWNPSLRRTLGTIASIGSLETAYLTWTKLTSNTDQLFCGTDGDCAAVLNGPYAVLPGTDVPLASLGFVAYTAVIALALGPLAQQKQQRADDVVDDGMNRVLLTALTTTMGVFSVFLMTLLFGVLHQSCPYCVMSAILSISLAKLSWLGGALPKERAKGGGVWVSVGGGVTALLAATAIFVSNDNLSPASSSSPPPSVAVNFAGELVKSSSSTLVASIAPGSASTIATAAKGQAPPPITSVSSARALQLARDLEQLDTRFFGAFWCSHCLDQKEELGKEAMAKIPYIECSRDGLNSQTALCKERNVPGYPTWEINGKLYPGQRDLEELEDIAKQARN